MVTDQSKNLRIISDYAVGYNNIDVEAATKRRIMVTNTRGVLTDTTADLTRVLLMGVARRAAVLSYLSDIASFLKRVFSLIIRVTVNLKRYRGTRKKKYWERLFGSKVPLYLLYAIQRE